MAQTKEYMREWYAKNKERLKSLPHRKIAKRESDRRYYLKNQEHLKQRTKEWRENNLERYAITKKNNYNKNKEKIVAERKILRATPEYKNYVQEYRLKNKEKINEQQRITSKRYVKKQVDEISESYIINLLTNQKVGIFKTHQEAKQFPELIKLYQSQLKLKRLCLKLQTSQS